MMEVKDAYLFLEIKKEDRSRNWDATDVSSDNGGTAGIGNAPKKGVSIAS